ncbi:MAG: heavy-metal-associated domain-containing protein [Woeseia sp.]
MTTIERAAAALPAFAAAVLIALAWPAAADEPAVYELQADGLACPFCAYGIEKQLGGIEGVEAVATDVKSGTVTITMEPGATLDEADAERAVDRAGFTMRDFRRRERTE